MSIDLVDVFPRPSEPHASVPADEGYVLLGQTSAFTDALGFADISGLIVTAAPGKYLLKLSVPEHEQVPLNS